MQLTYTLTQLFVKLCESDLVPPANNWHSVD